MSVLFPGADQKNSTRHLTRRGLWTKQIWQYTLGIAIGIGGLVSALGEDARLAIPIVGLSVLVGIVGTLMVFQQTTADDEADSKKDSIFR
jgi:hypothetical protein